MRFLLSLSRDEVLGLTECSHGRDIAVQCSGKFPYPSHTLGPYNLYP